MFLSFLLPCSLVVLKPLLLYSFPHNFHLNLSLFMARMVKFNFYPNLKFIKSRYNTLSKTLILEINPPHKDLFLYT